MLFKKNKKENQELPLIKAQLQLLNNQLDQQNKQIKYLYLLMRAIAKSENVDYSQIEQKFKSNGEKY